MLVKSMILSQDPYGNAVLTMTVDCPPRELSEVNRKIMLGDAYEVAIKPHRHSKTLDQNSAIWAKIGELASVLYANKEDIYEEILRRYGPVFPARIFKDEYDSMAQVYRLVDIVPGGEREDGTIFVKAYKGLSKMDSAEASRILEGVLDECREVGIDAEVKK